MYPFQNPGFYQNKLGNARIAQIFWRFRPLCLWNLEELADFVERVEM